MTHSLITDDKPDGHKLEDILNSLRGDIIKRATKIVDDHRPDIFKPDTDVAVIGILDPETGVFEGTKIFTKCPSKYEASDPGSMGSVAARSGESVPPEDPPIDPE